MPILPLLLPGKAPGRSAGRGGQYENASSLACSMWATPGAAGGGGGGAHKTFWVVHLSFDNIDIYLSPANVRKVSLSMSEYERKYIHTHKHTYIPTYTHTQYIHTYIHTYTHSHTHIFTHTCIIIYTHIQHTCIHNDRQRGRQTDSYMTLTDIHNFYICSSYSRWLYTSRVVWTCQ